MQTYLFCKLLYKYINISQKQCIKTVFLKKTGCMMKFYYLEEKKNENATTGR